MATAIFLGLLYTTKLNKEPSHSEVSFTVNSILIFGIYDILVLIALFRIGN